MSLFIWIKVKKLKSILGFVIPLLLSIALLYYIYSGENLDEQISYIKKANFFWLFLPVLVALFSNLFRALRWRMLIKASGLEVSRLNLFLAVLVGYFANFLLPRAGEVARCGVLKKYTGLSFTTVLGTVVTERIFDVIMTAIIMLLAFVFEFGMLSSLVDDANLPSKLLSILSNPFVVVIILILTAVFVSFFKLRNKSKLYEKGRESLKKFKVGMLSAKDVDNKLMFGIYTVLIFACYYLMLHFSFWAFDFTKEITFSQGLVIYVMGALGIIAPVQGGIGAWHFMTIQALVFYLGDAIEPEAKAFALVVHSVQTIVVYIGCGLLAYVLLPVVNKRK